MNLSCFRFYEELNEFLPARKRKQYISYSFIGNPSVKDAIESFGIPHVEVDMILVNGISVDFSYRLRKDDSVSVYPVFESLDISSVTHLREKPLRNLKFVLDVHLGKLAKYLRLCGFDTMYRKDFEDQEIISLALSEKRIILTRDIGILKNKQVTHGYWIRSQYPHEQLEEVLLRLYLKNQIRLFSRCTECNDILINVSKKDIMDRLLPLTQQFYRRFRKCPGCNRIYWKGTHYAHMKEFIESTIRIIK